MGKCARALVFVVVASFASVDLGAQGSAPLLVVVNSVAPNPFGAYLPEILKAEGLNGFDVVDLSALTAPTLAAAGLVVLAETPLTSGQATLLSTYVASGGRLVAMRPDAQLNAVLGISSAGGSTSNGYTLIDQTGPGAGLQAMTLPFKGDARHFGLAGATAVAALYSTATAASGFPAVVRYGRTAAWAFDLARSTAYVRQGDPAFAGLERDGLPPVRTTDVFFQNVDLERLPVPHADVQMRLFSRVVIDLLADHQPVPRLWYFPGTARTSRRSRTSGRGPRSFSPDSSTCRRVRCRPGSRTATNWRSIRSLRKTGFPATSRRATPRRSRGSKVRSPRAPRRRYATMRSNGAAGRTR